MDGPEKQEKIDLINTREARRPWMLFSEHKLWFWVLMVCAAFISFGAVSFYLSGGRGSKAVINGVLTGAFASAVVMIVRRDRYLEFRYMRIKRRVERVEKEMERFIVVLLRGMRLPLRNLGRSIDTGYQKAKAARNKTLAAVGPSGESTAANSESWQESFPWESVSQDIGELDSLAQGMLRIARARRADLKKDWIDVNSVVVGIVNELDILVRKSGSSVQMKTLPSCLGDTQLIREVFHALISNALQYTSKYRDPVVRIWGWTERNKVFYCVQDNGIGIEPDQVDKVFEMFYRVDPNRKGAQGLGLAIVRRVIEQHNGRLWLKSSPSKGSTFTFALPM